MTTLALYRRNMYAGWVTCSKSVNNAILCNLAMKVSHAVLLKPSMSTKPYYDVDTKCIWGLLSYYAMDLGERE